MFQYLPPRGTALVTYEVGSPPPKPEGCIRFVCVSDTHLQEEKFNVPDGDVLVHSGDILLQSSERSEKHADFYFKKFCGWLAEQPHKRCVIVCGNHDAKLLDFGREYMISNLPAKAQYLENETTEIAGVKIFGSPHSVGGSHNYAWQRRRADGLWDNIPPGDCDIVVSHGPAYCKGHLRYCKEKEWADALRDHNVSLHICGHLHWAYGVTHLATTSNLTTCVCASSMDGSYKPTNQAIMIDFPINRAHRVHSSVPSRTRKHLLIVTNWNESYTEVIASLQQSFKPLFNLHVVLGPDQGIAKVKELQSKGIDVAAFVGFGAPAVRVLQLFTTAKTQPLIAFVSQAYCRNSESRQKAHTHGIHLICHDTVHAESDIVRFCSLAYDLETNTNSSKLFIKRRGHSLCHPLVVQCSYPVDVVHE